MADLVAENMLLDCDENLDENKEEKGNKDEESEQEDIRLNEQLDICL